MLNERDQYRQISSIMWNFKVNIRYLTMCWNGNRFEIGMSFDGATRTPLALAFHIRLAVRLSYTE